jgi:two-component system, OmpR family, sensor histidine kinase MprB
VTEHHTRAGRTAPPPRAAAPPEGAGNQSSRFGRTVRLPRSWLSERLSLHARVTLLTAVAVGLAVGLVSMAAYLTVRQQMYSNLDQNLLDRAHSAAGARVLTDPDLVVKLPAEATAAGDLLLGLLNVNTDPDPTMFTASRASAPPAGAPELAVATGNSTESVHTATSKGRLYRVVAVPAGRGQALVLAQSLAPTNRTLHNLGVVLWVVGGLGVIGAAVAGNAVARSGLRPVAALTSAAEQIARTEQLRPIPVTGNDEIARLSQAFNAMLGALARSQERQRRLVGDAGHELRTPLTSVRTNLDLLIQADQRGGLAEADRRQLLDDVRAQMDELTQLIGDLTELARDMPQARAFEPLELQHVVEDAIARVRRRAPGLRWDVHLMPFPVLGDEQLLARAVTNLLDNAAKYSPPDGKVSVRLVDGTLTVVDSGPGIAPADLPHVFERFYRSAEARARPGSGLGLAIVKHAADQHGGLVYAGNATNGGAKFTLWLPHAQIQTRRAPDAAGPPRS